MTKIQKKKVELDIIEQIMNDARYTIEYNQEQVERYTQLVKEDTDYSEMLELYKYRVEFEKSLMDKLEKLI